ncbi:MAG TPA: hypothetical protein VFS34_01870 [Thermoanaerobaculia bacterium]|nr:hypothetical protein [Thermoanaerobaculia bacterium]
MRGISRTILGAAILASARFAAAAPETVHVSYHVQPGKLDELLGVLVQHYPAGRRAGIVLAEPHVILSGKEDGGKPVVIEVLTWRDADDPDDVATKHPEIKALWDRLNALVEKRGGRPGIEIDAMDLVAEPPAPSPKK